MNKYVTSRIFWLQILTLALLLAALVGVGVYAAIQHDAAQKRLEQTEPRFARLLGLLTRREDIGAFTAQTQEAIGRLAFPASQDVAQTGNEAQQRIRGIFADSKLDIGSIQVLPVKEGDQFDRIPIQLRIEGEMAGIQNALTLLATQTPTIGLETWSIQTIGAVRPASSPRLGAQFNFFVLRARS
jgi:general secretion pathway protein M